MSLKVLKATKSGIKLHNKEWVVEETIHPLHMVAHHIALALDGIEKLEKKKSGKKSRKHSKK